MTFHAVDDELDVALAEYEQATCRLKAEAEALAGDVTTFVEALVDGELVPFGLLCRGAEIRVAGEWYRIVGIRADVLRLWLLATGEKLPWWYQATDGETFTIRDPW